jgi:hypothetical protein
MAKLTTIQVYRGLKIGLPTLGAGEFGMATDTKEAFLGDGVANHQVSLHDEYAANSILAAATANTPASLEVAEQRMVGRKTGGNIAALTGAEVLAIASGQAGADFAMNTKKITGLADPTADQDAATKKYVDDNAGGAESFVALTDTPANFTSANSRLLRVNSAGNAVEFTDTLDAGTW